MATRSKIASDERIILDIIQETPKAILVIISLLKDVAIWVPKSDKCLRKDETGQTYVAEWFVLKKLKDGLRAVAEVNPGNTLSDPIIPEVLKQIVERLDQISATLKNISRNIQPIS